MEFLEDLYALLKAAYFRVLSVDEWDAALDYDFTVSPPPPSLDPDGLLPLLLQEITVFIELTQLSC